jgi:hypothetical protein
MKKIVLSTVVVMALASSSFAFGMPSVPGLGASSSSASSLSAADIDAVLSKAKQAEDLLVSSTGDISKAILSKEEAAKFDAAIATANKISNPKEKAAAIKTAIDSTNTLIAKAADDKNVQESLKKASNEKKEALASAGFNFLLAGKKDGEALLGVNSTVSSLTSNPSAAMQFSSQLSSLKDLASSLPTQGSSIVQIGGKLYDLMKAGGIKTELPATASDQPKKRKLGKS